MFRLPDKSDLFNKNTIRMRQIFRDADFFVFERQCQEVTDSGAIE
jgi:hypothetical protein